MYFKLSSPLLSSVVLALPVILCLHIFVDYPPFPVALFPPNVRPQPRASWFAIKNQVFAPAIMMAVRARLSVTAVMLSIPYIPYLARGIRFAISRLVPSATAVALVQACLIVSWLLISGFEDNY